MEEGPKLHYKRRMYAHLVVRLVAVAGEDASCRGCNSFSYLSPRDWVEPVRLCLSH